MTNQEPNTGFAMMWLGMILIGAIIVGGATVHDYLTDSVVEHDENPSELNETSQTPRETPQLTKNSTGDYPRECDDSSPEYDIVECEGNFTFTP